MRRLISLVLAAAFLLTLVPAVAASTPGLCGLSTQGNYHVWVDKDLNEDVYSTGNNFSWVQGEAQVRELETCFVNPLLAGYGSFVLPANLQVGTTCAIVQLGYGVQAGDSRHFFYANGANCTAQRIADSAYEQPELGHRYRFLIHNVNGEKIFTIADLTDGDHYTFSKPNWIGFNKAWWGYETLDTFSETGVSTGSLPVAMNHMGYITDTHSSTTYRSNLSEPPDVIWDFSHPGRHASISSTFYTNDTFSASTD